RIPIPRTQIGDACAEISSERVDRDLISNVEAEAVGNPLLDRHQGRPGIIGRPPFTGDQTRSRWQLRRVGYAAVALQHPRGVRFRLEIFAGHAARTYDSPA